MNYEYFYGIEADTFSFIQIPKALFKNPEFKGLKIEAKVLYGLMLDRMSLSRKNLWLDDCNRVFIIYTLENIMEDLGFAHTKCVDLLRDLEKSGLIERKKRGLGQPDIIYVKDFLHVCKNPEKPDKITDFSNSEVKTSRNENSGLPDLGTQDFSNSASSNTDTNNTEKNNTNKSVSVIYTLGNQSLTLEDYNSLVSQFGKDLVDYHIHRILNKPYRGMLRKDIITKWCQESMQSANRKVSGGCFPFGNAVSGSLCQKYDFKALNKFVQDN